VIFSEVEITVILINHLVIKLFPHKQIWECLSFKSGICFPHRPAVEKRNWKTIGQEKY